MKKNNYSVTINNKTVEVYCRGGKYVIEKDYYRWTMEAENIS